MTAARQTYKLVVNSGYGIAIGSMEGHIQMPCGLRFKYKLFTIDGFCFTNVDELELEKYFLHAETRRRGDVEARRCGGAEMWGRGDVRARRCGSAETRRRGDVGARRCGDVEERRRGDVGARRCVGAEMWRCGDVGSRRSGDQRLFE